MSWAFRQPLQEGSLLEGLLFLSFFPNGDCFFLPLQPAVLPSTLLAIDSTDRYSRPLPVGITPPSVR